MRNKAIAVSHFSAAPSNGGYHQGFSTQVLFHKIVNSQLKPI